MTTRWRDLTGAQWKALAASVPRLLRVRVLLATRGIAGTQRWLEHRTGKPSSPESVNPTVFDADLWHGRSVALRRIAARIPGTHCLARSMTLWHWLRQAGLPAQLYIGVQVEQGETRAHAWVEHENQAIDETAGVRQRFTPVQWRPGETTQMPISFR